MKNKFGKVKNFLLLVILAAMVATVIFILIDRAKFSDKIYRDSTYYKEQNGGYK